VKWTTRTTKSTQKVAAAEAPMIRRKGSHPSSFQRRTTPSISRWSSKERA